MPSIYEAFHIHIIVIYLPILERYIILVPFIRWRVEDPDIYTFPQNQNMSGKPRFRLKYDF